MLYIYIHTYIPFSLYCQILLQLPSKLDAQFSSLARHSWEICTGAKWSKALAFTNTLPIWQPLGLSLLQDVYVKSMGETVSLTTEMRISNIWILLLVIFLKSQVYFCNVHTEMQFSVLLIFDKLWSGLTALATHDPALKC